MKFKNVFDFENLFVKDNKLTRFGFVSLIVFAFTLPFHILFLKIKYLFKN